MDKEVKSFVGTATSEEPFQIVFRQTDYTRRIRNRYTTLNEQFKQGIPSETKQIGGNVMEGLLFEQLPGALHDEFAFLIKRRNIQKSVDFLVAPSNHAGRFIQRNIFLD